MNKRFYVPIILGTGREDRRSESVANFVFKKFKKLDHFETELVDVRKLVTSSKTIASWVESDLAKPWRGIAERSDGYIIVSPEYNHGYPGELKILLDMALKEYNRKPCGLCTVSSGIVGGARMAESLWPIILKIGMVPVMKPVHFMKAKELFDESGKITNPHYEESLEKLFDNLTWFVETLKYGRDKF